MSTNFETNGVVNHIDELSSAEDIFTYLLLPFEQSVLNVSRLHIMKRFGGYMRDADFRGQDQDAVFLAARQLLKRAYHDFIESTPLKEKVFKVFRDEEAKLKARFVGVEALQVSKS